MDEPVTQLDRIEVMQVEQSSLLRQLWSRVDTLERRASFWGVIGGMLIAVAGRLAGCG